MGQFYILMELYSFAIKLCEKNILGHNFAFFIGQFWLDIGSSYFQIICWQTVATRRGTILH